MKFILSALLCSGVAHAQQAPECIPPAQLQYTQTQLAKVQGEAAALFGQATKEIEALKKRLADLALKSKVEDKK